MIYAYFGKCELKYFGLFVADNDNSAIRIVEQELTRNEKLSSYCSEYSLYCLSDFNEDSGEILFTGIRFVKDLQDILLNYLVSQQKTKKLFSEVTGVNIVESTSPQSIDVDDAPVQVSSN